MALNAKQFPSEIITVNRSQIYLCDYNPRQIDEEGRKNLKRSLKKYGVLGGIIINRRNHPDFSQDDPKNLVCSGNQKVAILDAVNKYDPANPETDYELRVEVVDVDSKTEKEIVVVMNNQNVGGQWDYDKLRVIIPDIDFKSVGFTDVDLSMIGCDYMFQTEDETATTDALTELMQPDTDYHQAELEQRRMEREALKQRDAELGQMDISDDDDDDDAPAKPELTYEERKQQMKDLKKSVMEGAIEKASDMDAYFMITFTKWQDKAAFLQQWGYDPQSKFVKGEDFAQRIEGFEGDEDMEM